MSLVTGKSLLALIAVLGLLILAGAGFVWLGIYNVAADEPHSRPVYALLESLRERSIETRASKLQVPDLKDAARITQGAGNYDAMCTGCHLAPGIEGTELSQGLYPAPPNLTREQVDAGEAFWAIKHGIKATGMPAWGKSMSDDYIWNLVAFLQVLPELDADHYREMVASSSGHSHGGGETDGHAHAAGAADRHDDDSSEAEAKDVHVHADGKQHVHTDAAPASQPAATEPEPDDHQDHDHNH
jgi:mono/diheme cytochrome c family protein